MMPRIITFYSFKGGVGRTQALANVAVALANRDHDVVVVDMDLESPGLHKFFTAAGDAAARLSDNLTAQGGVLEYLESARELPETPPTIEGSLLEVNHPSRRAGRIRLLPAGDLASDYPERVNRFSWDRFYQREEGYRFMELFRKQLLETGAAFVLIDSRTGMTDVANICTFQLPDLVVALFALHQQGIDGTRQLAQAIDARRKEGGGRARVLELLLVPSRVDETGEQVLRDEWIFRVREALGGHGELLADHNERIPYLPQIAYGERIVVDPPEPNILSTAYESLVRRILKESPREPAQKPQEPGSLETHLTLLADRVNELIAMVRSAADLPDRLGQISSWAQDVTALRVRLLAEARAIRERIDRLDPGRAIDVDLSSLDSLSAWQALPHSLQRAFEASIQHRIAELRDELPKNAGGDREGTRAPLAEGERLLRAGDLAALESQRAELVLQAERAGLGSYLDSNKLTLARLRKSIPEDQLDDWLTIRTTTALEGDPQSLNAPSLLNLLRLRLHLPTVPTALDWTAYEVLDEHFDSKEDRQRLFEDVGCEMWLRWWRKYLVAPQDASYPVIGRGREGRSGRGRDALREFDIARVVSEIVAGLWRLWQCDRPIVAVLFERHKDDPCLRAAVRALGDRDDDADARRALLATWLLEGDPSDTEAQLSYLLALIARGYDAEAFYAMLEFAQSTDDLASDPRASLVVVSFLLRCLDTQELDLARTLLHEEFFRALLRSTRIGHHLLAVLAAGFGSTNGAEAEIEGAAATILLAPGARDHLHDALRSWIGDRDRPRADSWKAVQTAHHHARSIELGLKASWRGRYPWEKAFRVTRDEWIDRVVEDHGPRAKLDAEIKAFDEDDWIRHTHQREGGSTPNTEATLEIHRQVKALKAALLQLNQARPPADQLRLRDILAVQARRVRAIEALQEGLSPGSNEREGERKLRERVRTMVESSL